jgi:hypothetical protein
VSLFQHQLLAADGFEPQLRVEARAVARHQIDPLNPVQAGML